MKSTIILSVIAFCCATHATHCVAQSSDQQAIRSTIVAFAEAADRNDADQLASYLDDSYRIVMNRLFGSSEVSVMSKGIYLDKIRTKEFGGDSRQVEIESVVLNGTTASAKVVFVGQQMTSVSLLSLIKDGSDEWKLISDVPIVK